MDRRRPLIATTAAGIVLATSALASAQTPTTPAVKTGYVPVNGLKLYYEIRGCGQPLILLRRITIGRKK
jgi:ABC-type nitrate/sulfonate/bicarbonate transport system substrate-binding protein